MNKSGATHIRDIPGVTDLETQLACMATINKSLGITKEDKPYVAMCKTSVKMEKGEFHVTQCEWIEIKERFIKTGRGNERVASYKGKLGGGIISSDKIPARHFMTKCKTCSATRHGAEIIKGDL